jgi:glycosyltransferase involved in cell wall biosynthesis
MTNGEPPLVSVIVPVFNEGRLLPQAIACIRGQRDPRAEIVAVDSSTDDTPTVLERLSREPGTPLRFVYRKREGAGVARNAGVEEARGEILAFLDADDLWSADWLRTVRKGLEAEPDALVVGHTSVVWSAEASASEAGWNPPEPPVLAFVFGAMALRRTTWNTIGGVDPALRFGEDTAFSMVARERAVPIDVVPETMHFYRLHDRNSVRGRGLQELNVMRVLHESLRRRVSAGGGTAATLPPLRRAGDSGPAR